jgi:dTDP-4-dehydrorhamnose 3,5-epimerase
MKRAAEGSAMSDVRLIRGGLAVDDRGAVGFVNDFDFSGVRRFYMVQNHRQGFVRAWHAHRKEGKYALVVRGAALLCGVKVDDWERPSRDLPIARHVLSASSPAVLWFPPGFANGFMSLTDDAKILFFSTSTLEESLHDDIRWDARYWDPWRIEER